MQPDQVSKYEKLASQYPTIQPDPKRLQLRACACAPPSFNGATASATSSVPIYLVLLWGQSRHTGLPLPFSRTKPPEVKRRLGNSFPPYLDWVAIMSVPYASAASASALCQLTTIRCFFLTLCLMLSLAGCRAEPTPVQTAVSLLPVATTAAAPPANSIATPNATVEPTETPTALPTVAPMPTPTPVPAAPPSRAVTRRTPPLR